MVGTKRTSLWRFLRAFWYFFKHYSFTAIIVYAFLIPIFSWLGAAILRWGNIPYLSYTNFVSVAKTHPWAMLGLVGLLVVMLIAIYLQFAYLFLMVAYRRANQRPTIRQLLQELAQRLPRLSIGAFGFYLLYFILIVPFGGSFISTPLLAKVQIPEFIIEFITTKPLLLGLLALVYVVAFYFGLRLLLVIPIILFERKNVREAVAESWRRTWGRFWWISLRIVRIIISVALLYGVMLMGFYIGQYLFDEYAHNWSLTAAIVNFNLLTLVNYTIQILATVWILDLSIQVMQSYDQHALEDLPVQPQQKAARWWKISVPVAVVVVGLVFAGYGYTYFSGLLVVNPKTLSHRGVDNGNGVQNTIQALSRTHQQRPNYVEMDIQETRDHKFVVMHDPNLETLAGQDRVVDKQTLASMTNTTIHENGHQTKIDSFDAYLAAAQKMNQHLLVEIKYNPGQDRRALVNRFINRYADTLLTHHDIIHSLDYGVVEQLKTQRPALKVGYILPYNFVGLPQTKANFYTMEYSTLNERFVNEAHRARKQVFAWTVNDSENMDQMMNLDVDGIITDQLTTLNGQIKQQKDNHDYAESLLKYGLQSVKELQ
ncbi:glycerophosphoryl diester phosphodiesterase membrane domain-containing protein [Furfurilactobacillus siliginis]|uniref:Glycerophosphoryl diester phosphodiesterase n=1 Tax=Furfurilactobacillus siliginis TaxID=348151 RepID=A0A0R2KV03_9LACO|nr:glycerophosphodiester phosphodiesterase [Furfurilactobacillus siliginis]KRN93280.1 glycerophosphoryl diester phosphodiesterase [Furfurilactobacillus siliginis]GEK29619.1 glycerophosphoryl diester phosphodiesterase [Furfurilactobacillus siliginis]